MAITYLKKGKTIDDKAKADAKMHDTAKNTITDIAARKNEAIRQLSAKFDNSLLENLILHCGDPS